MTLPERRLQEALRPSADTVAVESDSEYPIAGIYSFGRGLIRRPTIRGSETNYQRLTPLHQGQLVMSKLNAWEGALAVVPDDFSGYYVSPEYPVFSLDETVAEPAYIAHVVKWPELWERLTPRGSMVRRKRTNPSILTATLAPLPDLDEQRRIAAKLDSASNQLASITKAQEHTRTLRNALRSAILDNAGPSRALGEVLSLSLSQEAVVGTRTYRIAGVYGFGRGLFGRGPISGTETSYAKLNRLREGTIVMSRLKAFEGALSVVSTEFDGWFLSPEFPTFYANPSTADIGYLAHICAWPNFWQLLSVNSKGLGARKERVNADRLLSIKVPLPSLDTQRKIAIRLDRATKIDDLVAHQRSVSAALQASLLNAAFSGEL